MQPRILYAARLSFRIEGEIKSFPDRQKLKICDHQPSSARNTKGESVIEEVQGNNPQKQGRNRYHDDTEYLSFNRNFGYEWV